MRIPALLLLAAAVPSLAAEVAAPRVAPAAFEGCHYLMTENECSAFLVRLSKETNEARRAAFLAQVARQMRERERACSCSFMARAEARMF